MRILIVEDEKVSRTKMRVIMNNFGECDEAENGNDAIEAFSRAWEMRAPYDIITLDIGLEDMNGIDVLISIRDMEKNMNIPESKKTRVIIVTAKNDREHITTCMTVKCDGYILKPFNKTEVTKKLRDIYVDYVNNVLKVSDLAKEPA